MTSASRRRAHRFALTQPKWSNESRVLAGDCSSGAGFPTCLAESEFEQAELAPKTMFVVPPGLELRYELR